MTAQSVRGGDYVERLRQILEQVYERGHWDKTTGHPTAEDRSERRRLAVDEALASLRADAEGQPAERTDLVVRARKAVGELRDAVRVGRIIEFRRRDELVIAIHKALDALEAQ